MENNNTILNEGIPKGSDQVTEETDQYDPVEASAYFIHEAHQHFKRVGYALAERKKRALVRVLEAVLFEPLEKVELIGKEEEELFALCQQIMYNKGVVLNYAVNRKNTKVEEESKGDTNV